MDKYLERELIKVEDMIGFYASRIISYPLVPPEHVYFSLTNRCCLRCVMCDIPKSPGSQENELSADEVKRIILQIKDLGVRHLIFSGGEPLLRDDLIEFVRFSRENGIPWVDIITNGVLCDDQITQKLIKAGLNHVTVSLDGISEVNDIIRGEGSFQKSAAAIDKFNYYKDKLNARHPSIGINFTILNKNINDMLRIVEFAKSKRCNTVVLQPVLVSNISMHDRKKNALWPSEDELTILEKNIHILINMKEKDCQSIIYTDPAILKSIPGYFKGKRPGKHFKCYEAIKRIVITCDGKLWSCSGFYGDLRKDRLRQVWFSAEAQKIRSTVRRCKAHCLQDCVYFPMDLTRQVKRLLSGLGDNQDNNGIHQRLIASIDYCVAKLTGHMKSNFMSYLSLKRELNKLNAVKREILKSNIAAE